MSGKTPVFHSEFGSWLLGCLEDLCSEVKFVCIAAVPMDM